MASPNFSYRHAAIVALASPNRTFLASGNADRIAITIANPNAGTAFLFNGPGSSLGGVITIVPAITSVNLHFRDWGPIIWQELWLGITGGPFTVYCVDLFRLPRGQ